MRPRKNNSAPLHFPLDISIFIGYSLAMQESHRYLIKLHPEHWRRLRLIALSSRRTVADLIREAIGRYLRANKEAK